MLTSCPPTSTASPKPKKDGQYGWGRALYYRCSHASRENAKEYFGTECGLWAIVAGAYLATMGPRGMQELGQRILSYAAYAIKRLSALPGVTANPAGGQVFQEFMVDFRATENPWRRFTKPCWPGTSLAVWTWARFSPAYAGYALYCVSDTTTAADIDTLCAALHDILGGTGA